MVHPSPIFIPSRGTTSLDGLAADLLEHDAPLRFVIEPQDLDAYHERFGRSRILIMGDDDRGPAYARNFILRRAADEKLDWFWIVDERVRSIAHTVPHPRPRPAIEVLASAESIFRSFEGPAIAGFSPDPRDDRKAATLCDGWNVACRGVVCLHAKRLGHSRYIHDVGPFLEDDLTLQRVTSGFASLRLGGYSYRMPRESPQLKASWLASEGEVTRDDGARAMAVRWGSDLCRVVRHPGGRVELSIDWSRLRSA